jgi:putative copper resistance protein D
MVDGLSAAARALSFIALFQAAGIALFLTLFGGRLPSCETALRRGGRVSAAIATALLIAQYALEAARMGGELAGAMDPSLQAIVLHSSTAAAFACRLVALALVLFALRARGGRSAVASIVGVTLVAGSFALMGHTTTHPDRALLSVMLIAHVLIVMFWFGALVPLYVASVRESAAIAGAVTEAFSAIALWIVPVLFIAGLVLAIFILQTLAALRTTYGQLLIVKVAGFAVLMGFAALNKWRLGPALSRGDAHATAAFRRSLLAEYLLIAAVLSVTAVLTSFYSPE